MSYDLYFQTEAFDPAALHAYFEGREHYQLHDQGAVYENRSTGVYFSFHYAATDDADSEDEPAGADASGAGVAFNLNYFRPSFFGLEAAIELEAFDQKFGWDVHDPQNDGMGDGPFSREGFLSGWTTGNRFAYSAMLNMPEKPTVYTCARAELESAWAWNYSCRARLDEMNDEVFLPRIMFVKDGDRAASVCVWPEAIPVHLPLTTYVLLGRSREDTRDFARTPWKDLQPLLAKHFKQHEEPAPYYAVEYKLLPTAIARFFGSLPAFEMDNSMGLAYDNVHAVEDVHG